MAKSKKKSRSIIPKNSFERKINTGTRKIGNVFFKSVNSILSKKEQANSPIETTSVKDLIKSFENKNAAIAAASSAIPGPMGMTTMTMEVTKILQNQLEMVYEISRSFQKDQWLNKDVLIDIPLHAMGFSTNLPNQQNLTKENLVESKQKEIKEKSQQLARVLLEKNLKKITVRSLPLVGPLMMSIWAKKNTRKIGETAVQFFDTQKNLVVKKPEHN